MGANTCADGVAARSLTPWHRLAVVRCAVVGQLNSDAWYRPLLSGSDVDPLEYGLRLKSSQASEIQSGAEPDAGVDGFDHALRTQVGLGDGTQRCHGLAALEVGGLGNLYGKVAR